MEVAGDSARKGEDMKKIRGFVWILLAVLPLCAILHAQQPATTSANQRAERIPNLDLLKKELRDYKACTFPTDCYSKDIDEQAQKAIEFLRKRAAQRKNGEKIAMVLDIDETTLSNYEEMNKADFAYDSAAFNAWIESAQAPAIEGTLRLYREARQLGVAVIFLTGRAETQRLATEKNLRFAGFADWEKLILRAPEQKNLNAEDYKSAERAKLVAAGWVLVLSVGDQWSDLRGAPEAEFSVKYPNPYYFLP
jgi:acid phosphatase